MGLEKRSLINWLLSGVSINTAYTALGVATFLMTIASFLVLGQIEQSVEILSEGRSSSAYMVAVDAIRYLKILIPLAFGSLTVFVILFGRAVVKHIFNQAVALQAQIDAIEEGNYSLKRPMRKHDELTFVMERLHQLSDRLGKH